MADILPSIKISPIEPRSRDGTCPDSPASSPTKDSVNAVKDGRPRSGGFEGRIFDTVNSMTDQCMMRRN